MDKEHLKYLKQLEVRISQLEDNNVLFMLERQINQLITDTNKLTKQMNDSINKSYQALINLTLQFEIFKYYVSQKSDLNFEQMFKDYNLLLLYMKENQLTLKQLINELHERLKGDLIDKYFTVNDDGNDENDKNIINKNLVFDDNYNKEKMADVYNLAKDKKIIIDADGSEWVSLNK